MGARGIFAGRMYDPAAIPPKSRFRPLCLYDFYLLYRYGHDPDGHAG